MADLHFFFFDSSPAFRKNQEQENKLFRNARFIFSKNRKCLDPSLNAIIYLDKKAARERAKEADEALAKGESWGALHGVPNDCEREFYCGSTLHLGRAGSQK